MQGSDNNILFEEMRIVAASDNVYLSHAERAPYYNVSSTSSISSNARFVW